MTKPLVIVESPAKARTLARLLGDDYRVEASVGHVRDLPQNASEVPAEIKDKPWAAIGVDVEHGFRPYYVVSRDKSGRIRELRAAARDVPEVLLATDPDREGESISWHLREVLKPTVPVRRIEFHEITEEAVRRAIEEARDIDLRLVDAQESRRIVDRLYGYMVSPVLWKKVQTGLSAGRVQSVAVRLVVEREEARRAFRKSTYWGLEARIRADDAAFTAALARVGSARVASGRDFDAATGQLKGGDVRLLDEASAGQLRDALTERLPWSVTSVEERPMSQAPYAPFTTSTLQQEANRKLGFSADRTMNAAQHLFQEGIISYHRTDSTALSERALGEAADAIRSLYGADYYGGPRQYRTTVKNAQEAHEAIRPTDFRRTPRPGSMGGDEGRLYELIWKRAVASQMADARLLRTSLEITAEGPEGPCIFTASGRTVQFAGFLRAYVEGSDDPAAELGDQETVLPRLSVGDEVAADGPLALGALEAKGHETVPPARYTDASLVKRLEEDGIGRPSTYASIISTIERRGYVFRQGRALVPTFTAFAVTHLLKEHFAELVELGFTGQIEENLDEISKGERARDEFLAAFYDGDAARDWPGLRPLVENETQIDYPIIPLGEHPESGAPVIVRIGRFGPYVQVGEGDEARNASVPDDMPPADFSLEQAVELVESRAKGPTSLGTDPASGKEVYVMSGRFGPYVQLGETPEKGSADKPRRASLTAADDPATVTLERAIELLALPRSVGRDPDSGEEIVANFGRYGPYVKRGSEFRSLASDDEVFTVTLDEALELLRQEKPSRRSAGRKVLRELGTHPASGVPVRLLEGRYGAYVTDGTTNATLPKDLDAEELTLETAVTLLQAREAAPSRKRGRAGAPRGGGARRAAGRKRGA
ncbi:MAG TPA: type I DNA topoisomerase [Candidatus Limnocylindria bacterium]|nr:type I DNA topoisomerase [Candidatus Limnocylindria bacterium]